MSRVESIAADSSDLPTVSCSPSSDQHPDSSSSSDIDTVQAHIDSESSSQVRVGVIRVAGTVRDPSPDNPTSSEDSLARLPSARIYDASAVPPRIDVIVGPQLREGFSSSGGPDFKIPPSPLVSSTTSPGIQPTTIPSRIQDPNPSPKTKGKSMGPPQNPPKNSGTSRVRKSAPRNTDEEEPSSSIPEIEFDGTTVLCRVCGDKASGFHYGVHSCEGCKGFFRRSIQQKIQYRPCTKNQQCSILRINRNRCQYCRLKKCIAVGMSRDAVRFGRVPKREKAKILAAMQSVNAKSAERALAAELADDTQVMNAVIRAHMETCDFTRDKVDALMANARRQPDYIACPPTLACPLNPTPAQINGQQQLLQDFSERFSPAIRGVVEYAKRLPGFSLLAQDDQVTLLKAGVFEVLLVRLAAMFDSSSNVMLCLNGQLLRRDTLHNSSNARFLMDSMFEFAERLNSLGLNDSELALFCAVVVIAADRPGLRNTELVERMQSKLRSILEGVLLQAHPEKPSLFTELLRKIPDLRTLNTLHSEKLLAFKMTEQQQQQQQQQQHHLSGLHAQMFSHQPPSPWTDQYDDDGAKSPVGSVSSSESVCSSEVAMSDLPLLAAVAGSAAPLVPVPHRRMRPARSEHGSTSSDGEEVDAPLRHLESPPKTCPFSLRKLDSPDDSGIESGMDRYEKLSTTSRSTATSICSSPRSSLEDKVKEVEDSAMMSTHLSMPRPSARNGGVDDMPVLKRVLQAPPLFDTNSLMDEAYRQHPHKKFRKHRRDGTEEVRVPETSPTTVLAAALSSPPAVTSALPAPSLTSTHSTLARSLMEAPKLSSEHQRRADLIVTNIMKGTTPSYSMAPCSPYPAQSSPVWSRHPQSISPLPVGSPVPSSPRPHSIVELQVGISDSQPQPLNLSMKSPASSPDRPTTPVSHNNHYFPLHA